MKLNSSGISIVELMIAIGIAGILSSVLLAVSLTFFGSTIRSQVTAEMAVDSHFMLRAIIEDLRLANGIAVQNDLSDPHAPPGGWVTSDGSDILVINTPATTSDNNVIYNDTTGDPYNNQLVYFVSSSTLFKRQLRNSSAPNNDMQTTCPAGQTSSTCPADRKYSSYVSNLSFIFYDEGGVETADVLLARSVRVNLSMSRRVFGKTLTFDNSTLTKLRN